MRSRLHFYHEANKVRTFFRLIFTVALLCLGIDGVMDHQRLSLNPIGNGALHLVLCHAPKLTADITVMVAIGSFNVVSMISMMVCPEYNRQLSVAVPAQELLWRTTRRSSHDRE